MKRVLFAAACALALVGTAIRPAAGQEEAGASMDSQRLESRSELQARLDSLQAQGGQALRQASILKNRLEEGDFRPGDVIAIQVWGDSAITGNYTVTPSRTVRIPGIEDIHLAGVLYSEADSVVTRQLSNYLRSPRVTVRMLTRVAVLGAVSSPGFYDLPPSSSVADAIMAAGGPTSSAKLEELQLRREGKNLLADRESTAGRVENMTLEQLGVVRGDALFVPEKGSGFGFAAVVGLLGALSGLAFAITRF